MPKIVKLGFLVFILGLILYTWGLDKVPVHLNQDELEFSLNSYSISRSLHDSNGNFLPFYFKHLGSFWATPVVVYWTAIFLRFLPLAEWSIRIPTAIVGVISALLIFILSHKIFKNNFLTFFSGVAALTSPALFINSRVLLDIIYPIPFVLLWLILLYQYTQTNKPQYLFLSGLSLGIGFHSYHAAKVMMPIYYIASLSYCFIVDKKQILKSAALITLGFAIPIIIFIPWLTQHPDTLTSQISYVSGIDRTINYNEGVFGVLNPQRIPQFISSYASYLSPEILFVGGDRSFIHSTRSAGAFLFPMIFFMVFGILNIIFEKRDNFAKLILFSFLTYPIAPSLINDPERISRGLIVIPFGILLATYGVEFLWNSKGKTFRFLVYTLIILSAVQFVSYVSYYFDGYRKVSYNWFNYDIGGAFESALKSTKIRNVKNVYLDANIPFVDRYWKFYEIKENIYPSVPVYFTDLSKISFSNLGLGSLVVISVSDLPNHPDKVGDFRKIETIREVDGAETFYVYFR